MNYADKYNKPASNQMQISLEGLTDKGQKLMDEAREWCKENEDAFEWFMREARADSCENSYPSADFLLQAMRRKFRVRVKNAYAPCLARISMEQDKSIRFKTARSIVDGFTTAEL